MTEILDASNPAYVADTLTSNKSFGMFAAGPIEKGA
jgi:hypothetical protein